MIAMIVAIWPRGEDSSDSDGYTEPVAGAPRATDAPVSDEELAQAHREAKIAPCPNTGGTPAAQSVLAGVTAPCLATGTGIDVGVATAGKPLVINIWAVWCYQCRKELPYFEEFARTAGDRVSVLGVHAEQGASNPVLVLKYLTEIGVHLPSVLDTKGQVEAAIGSPPLFPCTVLIRADGTVAKILPRLFHSPEEIADVVDEHLGVRV
ncbi:TlpA disulfide reductase family protein [Gordonia sp. ABSL1-1]|nr:TlpA disulfide reductase family protein [Gordonia sp. ABSL1-1]MDL9937536.1 TlpA disulfide reductase family protein [Gordonia sp. ABSL1-1]